MEDLLTIDVDLEKIRKLHVKRNWITGIVIFFMTTIYAYFIFSHKNEIVCLPNSSIILSCKIIQMFFLGLLYSGIGLFFKFYEQVFDMILYLGITMVIFSLLCEYQMCYMG